MTHSYCSLCISYILDSVLLSTLHSMTQSYGSLSIPHPALLFTLHFSSYFIVPTLMLITSVLYKYSPRIPYFPVDQLCQ
ncbi:hypothetical protein B0H11DRAFT_2087320, partial [Mycena galericulata]